MDKPLTMQLPDGFASMVSRRHNGNKNRTLEEVETTHRDMQEFYDRYRKVRSMRDHLLEVEWDEYRIEENYGTSLFNNAHRRLRRYEDEMLKLGKLMFARLTYMDAIQAGEWSPHHCISVDEIAADFSRKYKALV